MQLKNSKKNPIVVCEQAKEAMGWSVFRDNKGKEMLFCIDYWIKMLEINGIDTDLSYSVKSLSKYMIYIDENMVNALLTVFIEHLYDMMADKSSGTVVDNK